MGRLLKYDKCNCENIFSVRLTKGSITGLVVPDTPVLFTISGLTDHKTTVGFRNYRMKLGNT